MTLKQLTCLVALDRHRHFGRAAEACYLTQPALSMQVRKLERELGVELFDRSRSPVEPTDAGRAVVEQAARVLEEAERLRALAGDGGPGGEASGDLRLGVIPTVAPYLLPRLVSRMMARHPSVRLQVEEAQTEEIVERVRRAELDAAVIATPPRAGGVVEIPLFRERFVAYVSQGHRLHRRRRIRAGELRVGEVWLLNEGHCFRDQVVSICRGRGEEEGGVGGVRFESGNLETLRRLVEQSGGMTLLPELALAGLGPEERRRVRHFAEPAPGRELRLLHRRANLKRRLIEVLHGELAAAAPVPAE